MLRKNLKKDQTLLKINNAIIHQRTRIGLFKEITVVLKPLLNFDRISILINRPGRQSWDYFSPALGVNIPELKNNTVPPQKAVIPLRAMTEKKTIVVDLQHQPLLPETKMLLNAGLNRFVCCPLFTRDRAIGSIQLFYREIFPITDNEIDIFENVSQQIALAIDNMLAYEELEQLRDNLAEEKAYLKKEIEALDGSCEIIYECLEMQGLMDTAKNVASTDATVLITGETGTGKDLVARTIHDLSERKSNTFVKVNCAALVPTLIESELFGHEKGAFTGAAARRIGRFETADNSTLFLDEISELPINTQAKILQVLQDGVFERVGGTTSIKTDVRIIAATNQDLRRMVAQKKFREDLFYRLNIFPIHVPPLRDRAEDIPVLGRYFGAKFCEKLHRPRPFMDKDAIDLLMHYSWPGNVRELQNFIERIIILKSGQTITAEDIRSVLNPAMAAGCDDRTLVEVERNHIKNMLQKTRGKVAGTNGAAQLLGLKRSTLQYKMRKLGIEALEYKK